MKKFYFVLAALLPVLLWGADTLEITTPTPAKAPYMGKTPLEFTLKLDAKADSAKLLYFTPPNNYFDINGKKELLLTPSADRKVFTGKLPRIDRFFNWAIYAGWDFGPHKIQFIPVITRNGKEIQLKGVNSPRKIRFTEDLMMGGNLLPGAGKFEDGLHFDGKDAIAGVRRISFNADKGSVDMWLFMPLMLQQKSGIVFFIQAEDGSGWSYQQLSIPAKSRQLTYTTYRYKERKSYTVRSKAINTEDFIFVQCRWDAAKKEMELLVDGKSIGKAPYMPAGGKRASVSLGGRLHHTKKGPVGIGYCQMVLDEFRVTSDPAILPVPAKPYVKTPSTFLLLHMDKKDLTKNLAK